MADAPSRSARLSNGRSVDSAGNVAYDPSRNVEALVEAESRRQDDLRAAAKELSDTKHIHEQEISTLREEYQEKLQHAESGRLDSIRQVDREEVAKTAVSANTAIAVLAKQTTDLAVMLDKKVADTATATEQRNSTANADFNKRIAALELSSSEGKGKQTVADPQMEKLASLVEILARNQAAGAGKSEGVHTSWLILLGVVSLLGGLFGIAGVLYAVLKP